MKSAVSEVKRVRPFGLWTYPTQCVVVLGGQVPSWMAKRAAGDDPWDTQGVVDVSNQLVIQAVAD